MKNMVKVHIISTRLANGTQLTYGKGKLGAATLTGTVYDASDYVIRVSNEYGLMERVDLSDQLYGLTCTASISSELEEEVKESTAAYFAGKDKKKIFEIELGIIFEVKKIQIIDGFHPTLKIPTKTLYLNDPAFIGVEEPEKVVLDAQQLMSNTQAARSNTQERSELSLLGKLRKQGEGAINSLLGKPPVTK